MTALVAIDQVGTGDPLVLLHGVATDRGIWESVTPRLAEQRRVVTLDLPGFGRSAPVGDGFELKRVADRIARGLAGRGVRGPFDLVGHSLGGGVALTLAAERPRLVRRLILVAPAGLRRLPGSVSALIARGADGALAARRAAEGLVDVAWGRRLLLAFTAGDPAELDPEVSRRLIRASEGAARTAPAIATITSIDLRPLLDQVRAPVSVIWGDADRTIPIGVLDDLLAVCPHANVEVIAGAGHVPMIERPEQFSDALIRLLRSASGNTDSLR